MPPPSSIDDLRQLRLSIARSNAAVPAESNDALRSDFGGNGVEIVSDAPLYSGFFGAEEMVFRHRLFEGGTSGDVRREVFSTGDAVAVLPYDPNRDCVLMIEQVRAGPIRRGDPNPWSIEVVAGLIDRAEGAEVTARREAEEEAGLQLGRLEKVGAFYTSPGAVSEFLTAFIGEADLGGEAGVYGLDVEAEDIRGMILPYDDAMAALDRGEIRNGPALVALLALARRREELRAKWCA